MGIREEARLAVWKVANFVRDRAMIVDTSHRVGDLSLEETWDYREHSLLFRVANSFDNWFLWMIFMPGASAV